MRKYLYCIIALLGIIFCSQHVSANTSYTKIYTADDLYNVRNDLSGNYILMNDIDLSAVTAKGGDYDYLGYGWNPIGSENIYSNKAFTGIFNGNNHVIKGMRIDITSKPDCKGSEYIYLGLFANNAGTIKNLTITDSSISSINLEYSIYAGVVSAYNTGTIYNCINRSTVDVAGYLLTFQTDANRHCLTYVGGICGCSDGGNIERCQNYGTISGMAGKSRKSTSSTPYISVSKVAGILGVMFNQGTVSRCFNSGTVTAVSTDDYSSSSAFACGVLGGTAQFGLTSSCIIEDCYNSGRIEASSKKGAVASGISYGGSVYRCYAVGELKANSTDGMPSYNGIGGRIDENCFYLASSNIPSTTADTALSENLMKKKSSYEGFDFDTVWRIDSDSEYLYPTLRKEVDIIEWKSLPEKLAYYTDSSIDVAEGVITAYYLDGTYENIQLTEDMITDWDTSSVGTKKITVSCVGKNLTYDIVVTKRPNITSVEQLSEPDKKEFVRGTSFDFSGWRLKVNYDDGTNEIIDITSDMTTGGDIFNSGTYTISYTFNNETFTTEVAVVPVKVIGIKVVSEPCMEYYVEGQDLESDDIVVNEIYNTGEEKAITGYEITGYESTLGTHTVTVTYNGFSDSFDVEVIKGTIKSLLVATQPTKSQYFEGQAFEPDGMVIKAVYSNGFAKVITDYTISSIPSGTGTKKVTISCGDVSTTVNVTVVSKTLQSIEITKVPDTTEYIVGEEFDSTGLIVSGVYNDSSKTVITDYTLTGNTTKTAGTKTVTVVYAGKTTTFTIIVKEKTLTGLTVTEPDKKEYIKGESFDPTGMVVEAKYDNGKSEEVSDYDISGFTGDVGSNIICVTYGTQSYSFIIDIHNPSGEWTTIKEATCEDDGKKVQYCTECNKVCKVETIKALGHDYKETVTKKPSCTENGVKTFVCKHNSSHTYKEDIPALGHTPEVIPEVIPSCEQEGYTEGKKCSVCGKLIEGHDLIPASGHDFNKKVVDPTCTEEGYSEYACKNCEYSYKSDFTDALGHTVVIDEAVPATETTTGLTEGSHCSICKELIKKQEIIPTLSIKVTGIKISGISTMIAAGKNIQLAATVAPANATNKTVKWSSNNTKIAIVNQKGFVTVKPKTGGKSVIITAAATDGSGVKVSWKIKSMKGAVKKITIKGEKKVKAGKALKLKAKVKATKGANKVLKWTSSNPKWAVVNGSGKVFTKAAGKGKTVKITAMATDGSKKKKTVSIKIK